MNWQNVSRYKLTLVVPSLFSIGLLVFMLAIGTSSVEAAPKKTPTPSPTIAPPSNGNARPESTAEFARNLESCQQSQH